MNHRYKTEFPEGGDIMKKMLQKALLGMMLLSLLITGILIPSLA